MMTITAIGRTHGVQRPLATVAADSKREADLLKWFSSDGFVSFIEEDRSVIEMAVEAVEDALKKGNVARAEVDAVIVTTESFWDVGALSAGRHVPEHLKLREGILEAIYTRVGLDNAYPYAAWLCGCSNVFSALNLAKALLESKRHRRIVLVSADRFQSAKRLIGSGLGVFSDLALACVLEEGGPGYGVREIALKFSPSLLDDSAESMALTRGRDLTAAFAELAGVLRARSGVDAAGVKALVTDNFHSVFVHILAGALGVPAARVAVPLKADIGHTYGTDALAALGHLGETHCLSDGDVLLLTNTGQRVSAAAIVEVRAG